MPMNQSDRICALVMAMFLFVAAVAYGLIMDYVVMKDYHVHVFELSIENICWISAPAVLVLLNGLLLITLWWKQRYIDWDDQYRCSPYTGTKFDQL